MTPPGTDPGTVRLVAQRLNHYATTGPLYKDTGANNNFYILILTVLDSQCTEFIEFNLNNTSFSLLP